MNNGTEKRISKIPVSERLPCLSSELECVEWLQFLAVENSQILKLVSDRENVLAEKIEEGNRAGNSWINIALDNIFGVISNPITGVFELGRDIFGNGQSRRAEKIALADLELQLSQIQLNSQQVEVEISAMVAELVGEYEKLVSESEQLASVIQSEEAYYRLMDVDYRYGGGSTKEMISAAIAIQQKKSELSQLYAEAQLKIRNLERLILEGIL